MAHIETRTSARGVVSYRVRYRLAGRQKVLTCATQDGANKFVAYGEAFGWQAAHDAAHATGTDTDKTRPLTVVECVTRHIDSLTGITAGTRADYRAAARRHIEPFFGDLPLAGLTDEVAARWVTHLHDAGLGGKSIRNRHALLSTAVEQARTKGLISANPLRGQRLPKTLGQEMCFLEPAELATLLTGTPEHYRLFVTTLAGTGMRFGEATALQVKHLEPATSSIRVVQAWKANGVGAGRELGVPKSRAGVRTIAVPSRIMAQLIEHTRGRKPDAFVFTNTDGGVIRQGTFYRNAWVPAVAALAGDTTERRKNERTGRYEAVVLSRGDGKRPRVHDLRHTFASWAISAGTPLPVIQRQLGHEKITTTVDTYGHLARADFDAMAARISANLPDVAASTAPAALEAPASE